MTNFVRACALALSGGWLEALTSRLTWRGAAWGVGLFLLTFSVSLAVTVWVLVKLPANYFRASHQPEFLAGRSPAVRWAGKIGKNLLGVVLVVAGVLMLIGPGQGIITILLGIMMLDIPGKRKLEIKLVSRPKVLHAINRIRARFQKKPLALD